MTAAYPQVSCWHSWQLAGSAVGRPDFPRFAQQSNAGASLPAPLSHPPGTDARPGLPAHPTPSIPAQPSPPHSTLPAPQTHPPLRLPPVRLTTLSGFDLSTPVAASKASLLRLSQAMMQTAARQKAAVRPGSRAPVSSQAAAAETRMGAKPTEYMGALMAALSSAARSSPPCGCACTVPSGSMTESACTTAADGGGGGGAATAAPADAAGSSAP